MTDPKRAARDHFAAMVADHVARELTQLRRGDMPPHDYDAEQELCCAVVGGVPPSALPVAALDFYAALFRHVFATCVALEKRGVLPSPAAVAKLMREAGAIGPIEEEIHRLVAVTPYYTVKRLHGQAEVVVEMRRRRELLALLARIEAGLRTGSIDSAKALEVLGRKAAERNAK